jgi:hypothetical protein
MLLASLFVGRQRAVRETRKKISESKNGDSGEGETLARFLNVAPNFGSVSDQRAANGGG